MRKQILSNIENPKSLENLYRSDKSNFKAAFLSLYPNLQEHQLSRFWFERLSYDSDSLSWGPVKERLFVVMAVLLAGVLAKLPALFPIDEEFFYTRNAGFLVFPFLSAYYLWKYRIPVIKQLVIYGILVLSMLYINFLPGTLENDTLVLACIHLPLLLWMLFGLSFTGKHWRSHSRRLEFLRFNGDLLVMTALLVLAGIIMTGVTIGLFEIAGLRIEDLYFEYIVLFALPAIPILANYLTQHNPHLVNKVSPVIARIFSPLVLVMLVIYLASMAFLGKDPFTDRNFLLVFNILLIGVMALIFFSVAEDSGKKTAHWYTWIILFLSLTTVVVNSIALSAIVFRISEWGLTPNRLAVLGANVLMLIHLVMITGGQIRFLAKRPHVPGLGRHIVVFLPVYLIWLIVVVFAFPFLF